MTSLTDRLEMLITADGTAAKREFQSLGASAQSELGKAQSSSDKMGSTFIKAGAGMVLAGGGIIAVLGQMTGQFESHQQAEMRLQNTMSNTPKLAGANIQAFLDQAHALQQTTEASDVQIETGQALLGQFNLTQDQVLKLTPLVVDLSQKMGVGLDAAAKAVGKSVDGSSTALKRYGIIIDPAKEKTDAFGATVDGLRSTVGGFAEQQGATFQGRLIEIKNQLGDIEAGVGKGAAQAFEDMLKPVQGVSDAFGHLDGGTQSLIGEIAAFGGVALIVTGATSVIIGSVIKMASNFTTAGSAVVKFFTEMDAYEAEQIIATAAFTAAIGGIVYAIHSWDDATSKLVGTSQKKIDFGNFQQATVGINAMGHQVDDLGNKWNKMSDVEKLAHPEVWKEYSDLSAQYDENLKHIAAERSSIEDIGKALGISGSAAQGLVQALHVDPTQIPWAKLEPILIGVHDGSITAAQGQRDLAGAMGGTAKATQDEISAATAYNNMMKASVDPVFAVVNAQQTLAQAQATLADDQKSGTASAAQISQDQWAVAQAAEGASGAIATLSDGVKDGSIKMSDATTAIQGWAAQGLITAAQAQDLTNKLNFVAGAADNLNGKRAVITVDGNTEPAIDALNSLITFYDSATVDLSISAHVAGSSINRHAVGGQLNEGWNMVGEAGAELVHKQGSQVQVLTAAQTSASRPSAAASAAPVVNLNFTFAPGITTSDQAAVQGFVRTVVIPELSRAVSSGIKR